MSRPECLCLDGLSPSDKRDILRASLDYHGRDCARWRPVRTVDDVESLDVPSDVQGYL